MNIENIQKIVETILVLVKSIVGRERFLLILIKLVPLLKVKFKQVGAEIKDLDEEEINFLIEMIIGHGFDKIQAENFLNHMRQDGKITIKSIIKSFK
jgi:hypothetical protein